MSELPSVALPGCGRQLTYHSSLVALALPTPAVFRYNGLVSGEMSGKNAWVIYHPAWSKSRGAAGLAAAFLSLGSNLGDRESNIRRALDLLARRNVCIVRVSSMYETEPVGFTDQPDFINAVAEVDTDLSPPELLHTVLGVEREMGRVRNLRWGPRVIDIDILLYDELRVDTEELTIPHPRMMERAFVLAPLAETAPDLVLPDGRTASQALQILGDQGVRRMA